MVLESNAAWRFNRAMQCVLNTVLGLACLFLMSCSSSEQTLQVKSFVLRDQERDTGIDPWARMEKLALLHGAISLEERKARLGQYYTVLWNDDSELEQPVRIVFEYQQGGTANKVKTMKREFAPFQSSGRASFAVIGEECRENGRVLAWQVTLFRGDREVDSRRSYLWK